MPAGETTNLGRAIVTAQGSPPNLHLVTVYNQNQFQCFDAVSGEPESAVFQPPAGDPFPSFSPDARLVAVVSSNGLPELRDAKSAGVITVLESGQARATNRPAMLKFSSDGKYFFAAWAAGAWGVWNVAEKKLLFSSDGNRRFGGCRL
ncbi:MAG: hypothetical protein WDM80_17100 [Limisphaerales bacterium]